MTIKTIQIDKISSVTKNLALKHEERLTDTLSCAMGTAPCVDECLKTWRPLAAPANALPSGHWAIMERSNGTRQWAYKGFAAYTYAGDTKPGERSGSDIYDIFISNDPTIDIYQDGNVYKDDKEMKYGRRVLRARDSAANFWAYLEP